MTMPPDSLLVTIEEQATARSQRDADAAWLADLYRWSSEDYRHQLAVDTSRATGTPIPEDTRVYLEELAATRERNHAAMTARVTHRDAEHQKLRDKQQRADSVAEMLGDELPSVTRRRLNSEIDRLIASGRKVGAFLMRSN
jgi:hypothetical protein